MDNLDYLIDRKIEGSITTSEAKELEQLILNRPDIAEDIAKRIDISKAIQYAGNEELRMSLKQIHKEEFPQGGTGKIISLKMILSIAAILVLGILSYIFVTSNPQNDLSGIQAFASHYKPYKATFQSRGEVSEIKYKNFKNAYSNGSYKEAFKIISEVNNIDDILDNEILLTMGISALETGKLSQAKKYFQAIIDRDDYFFEDHANWYLALVYIKEENSDKAVKILERLSADKDADHSQDAKELLTKIK